MSLLFPLLESEKGLRIQYPDKDRYQLLYFLRTHVLQWKLQKVIVLITHTFWSKKCGRETETVHSEISSCMYEYVTYFAWNPTVKTLVVIFCFGSCKNCLLFWSWFSEVAEALVSASSWSNSCCSTIPQRPQCGIDWATCLLSLSAVILYSVAPLHYPAPSRLCCCFNTNTDEWPILVLHSTPHGDK